MLYQDSHITSRTEVTPVVKFKLNFLLPVVTVIGNLFPGLAQHLFALAHVDDVVEQYVPETKANVILSFQNITHSCFPRSTRKIQHDLLRPFSGSNLRG